MADPISDAEKTSKLDAWKRVFNGSLDQLSENLVNRRITLQMWEADFRTRLREYLTGAAMIGKGDPTRMTPSDWGRVGAELKKQYQWIHGFAQAIYDNPSKVTLASIQARAHLYGDAGNKVATVIQAGYFAPNTRREPELILSWMPGDGSTACLNKCGCNWELEVLGEDEEAGTKTVQVTWVLHPEKEHCEDCAKRESHVEVVDVGIDVDVPPVIGV